VNSCHECLEPPWESEIITLPLPEHAKRSLLVVRVHASTDSYPRCRAYPFAWAERAG